MGEFFHGVGEWAPQAGVSLMILLVLLAMIYRAGVYIGPEVIDLLKAHKKFLNKVADSVEVHAEKLEEHKRLTANLNTVLTIAANDISEVARVLRERECPFHRETDIERIKDALREIRKDEKG